MFLNLFDFEKFIIQKVHFKNFSCIKRFQNLFFNYIFFQIYELIILLTINLLWIPSHISTLGIEITDIFATFCACFIPSPIKISYSEFSTALKAYRLLGYGIVNR